MNEVVLRAESSWPLVLHHLYFAFSLEYLGQLILDKLSANQLAWLSDQTGEGIGGIRS